MFACRGSCVELVQTERTVMLDSFLQHRHKKHTLISFTEYSRHFMDVTNQVFS